MIYNILHVEDEGVTQFGIKRYFEEKKHIYKGVKSNAEAYNLLNSFQPDIIITDVKHEGTATGIDLASEIKKSNKNLPVVCVSGNSPWVVFYSNCFDAILDKPTEMDMLYGIVKRLLSPPPCDKSFFYMESKNECLDDLDIQDEENMRRFGEKIEASQVNLSGTYLGFEKCGPNLIKLKGLQIPINTYDDRCNIEKHLNEKFKKLLQSRELSLCVCKYQDRKFATLKIRTARSDS